jgi:hypothetical protein
MTSQSPKMPNPLELEIAHHFDPLEASLDTFSDFNFAGDELLSFLHPKPLDETGVDFASWLHMRDVSSSPTSYELLESPLIEPGESEEMFVHQEKPKSSITIDDNIYSELQEKLEAEYKVFIPKFNKAIAIT